MRRFGLGVGQHEGWVRLTPLPAYTPPAIERHLVTPDSSGVVFFGATQNPSGTYGAL